MFLLLRNLPNYFTSGIHVCTTYQIIKCKIVNIFIKIGSEIVT